MRARQPDRAGYAVNRGGRLYYEVHGGGPLAVLLVPPWPVVTSAFWKMQLPFLARHYTVVLYDPRGNGRSDRPEHGYSLDDVAGDALAVLDELGIDRCALLTVSGGIAACCHLAARHPRRVSAVLAVCGYFFNRGLIAPEDAEARRRRRLDHFDEWVRQFWAGHFSEPHSTKAQDDGWEWTHETTAPILNEASRELQRWDARPTLEHVRCPVLLIHGLQETDHIESFVAFRALPQSVLVTMITPGHLPNVRDPVKVNLLLREFLDRAVPVHQSPSPKEEANARA